jgi:hypothetical protein
VENSAVTLTGMLLPQSALQMGTLSPFAPVAPVPQAAPVPNAPAAPSFAAVFSALVDEEKVAVADAPTEQANAEALPPTDPPIAEIALPVKTAQPTAINNPELPETKQPAGESKEVARTEMMAVPREVIEVAAAAPAPAPAPELVSRLAHTFKASRREPTSTSLSLLQPQFRGALARVVQRLETEHGLDVRVNETYRTQERQNLLYEQGRTTEGPVVTWTRSSNHTRGLAADLQIKNGTPAAYEMLAKVAAEEGLHTLGPRDPGHVEWRGASEKNWMAHADARVIRSSSTTPYTRAPQTTPAYTPVATAAPVGAAAAAPVAHVAAVAQVGQVGNTARMTHVASSPFSRTHIESSPDPAKSSAARSSEAMIVAQPIELNNTQPQAVLPQEIARPVVHTATAPDGIALGVNTAARVDQIDALREAAHLRAPSFVTLDIGSDPGTETVRIAARGSNLNLAFSNADHAVERALTSNARELQATLQQKGFDAVEVSVAGRLAAASPAASSQGAVTEQRHDQGSNSQHGAFESRRGFQSQQRNQQKGRNDERNGNR